MCDKCKEFDSKANPPQESKKTRVAFLKSKIGEKFNHWTILGFNGVVTGYYHYLCKCDCGKKRSLSCVRVLGDKTKQCKECYIKFVWHKNTWGRTKEGKGLYGSPIYSQWRIMINGCYCKTDYRWESLGWIGIKVCDEWRIDFMRFYKDMGKLPKYGRLSRIDNTKDFCADNCKWKIVRSKKYRDEILNLLKLGLRPMDISRKLKVSSSVVYRLKYEMERKG